MEDPEKTDKLCRAKLAILQALDKLEHVKEDVFLQGRAARPARARLGGSEDTAVPLRAAALIALARIDADGMLTFFVDSLADPAKDVRMAAAQALGYREARPPACSCDSRSTWATTSRTFSRSASPACSPLRHGREPAARPSASRSAPTFPRARPRCSRWGARVAASLRGPEGSLGEAAALRTPRDPPPGAGHASPAGGRGFPRGACRDRDRKGRTPALSALKIHAHDPRYGSGSARLSGNGTSPHCGQGSKGSSRQTSIVRMLRSDVPASSTWAASLFR